MKHIVFFQPNRGRANSASRQAGPQRRVPGNPLSRRFVHLVEVNSRLLHAPKNWKGRSSHTAGDWSLQEPCCDQDLLQLWLVSVNAFGVIDR